MIQKTENFIVKEFELELLSSETRKSPQRLKELLSDDFFEFTQSGTTCTKQDIIDVLQQCPEEKFVVRDYSEKKLSTDVVLVHYIADREIVESGEKRCTLCSSIWQNINNRWQMVFFQGTPAMIV
jgi:hypothetical protein